MLYELKIADNKFEVIKKLVFKNFSLIEKYLNETFPYNKKNLVDNCPGQSFCIYKNNKMLYLISINRIEPIEKIKIKKPKAYGSGTYSIFEIFNNEDAPIITKKFRQYVKKMKEQEDCVDSFRIGLINDKQSMKEYNKLVSCCGRNDTKIKINGKEYMFGCNYGH